jgi:predicted nuclease with RNAse H fold
MPLTAREMAELAEDAVVVCQALLRLIHPKATQPTKAERKELARMLRDFAIKLAIDLVD